MQEQNDDIEQMLARYRPASPRPALRKRALAAAEPLPCRGTWPVWVFRSALAALVALAIGLNHVAERMNHATAARIGIGPVTWTADAEQAAETIGGEEGRQYIAVCLMASTGRDGESQNHIYPKGASQ